MHRHLHQEGAQATPQRLSQLTAVRGVVNALGHLTSSPSILFLSATPAWKPGMVLLAPTHLHNCGIECNHFQAPSASSKYPATTSRSTHGGMRGWNLLRR